MEFNSTDYKTSAKGENGSYPPMNPVKNVMGNLPCEVEVDATTQEVTITSPAKDVHLLKYTVEDSYIKLEFGFTNSFGKDAKFNTILSNPFNSPEDKKVDRVTMFNRYTLSKLYEGLSGKEFPSFAFKTMQELLDQSLGTLTTNDVGNMLVEFKAEKDGSIHSSQYLNIQLHTRAGEAPDYASWCSKDVEELDVNRILTNKMIYDNEYFKGVCEKFLGSDNTDDTEESVDNVLKPSEESLEEILGF